jgi:prepilin-type processing-associated H-X9-DG protein
MSFKVEVRESRSTTWVGNALRFATHEEADGYGAELLSRWTLPEAYRVVEDPERVNYAFVDGRAQPLKMQEGA